jgi:hypothetical protein
VNYSGGQFQKPEGGKFGVILPGAPDTVRCVRRGQPLVVFCSFYLNPFLDFLLVCVEPLAPVELIIESKLVSPIICVGQFNHQNLFRKMFDPISLSKPKVEFLKKLKEILDFFKK